jgi:hypothetical protein
VIRLLYTTSTDSKTFLLRKPSYDVRLYGVNIQNSVISIATTITSDHKEVYKSQIHAAPTDVTYTKIAFDWVHGVTIQARVFFLVIAITLLNLA